jgi:glycosyltransferase involved in cell wall biosynthesis
VGPTLVRHSLRQARRQSRRLRARLEAGWVAAAGRLRTAELAIFHDFRPAPAGGASQSLRAVAGELARRGVRIELNTLSPTTRACLFNSFNFDAERLALFARRAERTRMIHRVGAVTTLYRGFDDGTDARVAELNRRFADATLAISHATITMYRELGIELVHPTVVHNGCDPRIFNREGRAPFDRARTIRLISSSWSANENKGAPVYRWLEENLDWSRYEFTFVGNTPLPFSRIRHVPPVPSHELARLLREHDVFVTATRNDAYSNALVEALSCGLPAVYLDSGGSREAVEDAGFGFTEQEEIPALLDRLVDEYEERQAAISLPSLAEVADGYLALLGLDEFVGGGERP